MNHRRMSAIALFLALIVVVAVLYPHLFYNRTKVVEYYYSPTIPSQEEKVVCIVFDDGWKTQLDAVPVLDKYEFKATFAIITSYVGTKPAYMDWSQIQELASDQNDIESHSYSHISLNKVSEDILLRELEESKKMLQEHGYDSELFVYSFGDGSDNSTVRDSVAMYYLAARGLNATDYDLETGNRYFITSYGIENDTSMDDFISYVQGAGGEVISVLYYHQIGEGNASTIVPLSRFEDEMAYLNATGYSVKTLRELLFKPLQDN